MMNTEKHPRSQERCRKLRDSIKRLYAVVDDLSQEFSEEKRKFTLDGHLVGSIGEVVAAYAFNLRLLVSSTEGHDAVLISEDYGAVSPDDTPVQIKLTGGTRGVGLYSCPKHLIVLQLANSKFNLVYNGPGVFVYEKCNKEQKNGQRSITLKELRRLNEEPDANPKLKQHNQFPELEES